MKSLPREITTFFLTVTLLATTFIAQRVPTTPCDCPKFIIEANLETVKAGDSVEFMISNLESKDLLAGGFEWTLSRGTIVSGQGTARIVVQTSQEMLTAPTPKPTPMPDPGEHGYIIGGPYRRSVEIKAMAKFIGSDNCTCAEASATVRVGRYSVLPNRIANVTGLKLDEQTLTAPCIPGRSSDQPVSEDMLVDVEAAAVDPEDDVLTYNYTVTGGRIIGTGAKVKWDLTGVAPGSYTITVGVDDGCGICGKTKTEEIKIVECQPLCVLFVCPTISITGPDKLKDENEFTADVRGGSVGDVSYAWTVTNGVIISGQGTPSVKVRLEPTSSISVKIGGLEGNYCIESATKSFRAGSIYLD